MCRGVTSFGLCLGPWWGRPALAAAFFDGYGGGFSDADREFIRLYAPAVAVVSAVWGGRHSDRAAQRRGRNRLRKLMARTSAAELGLTSS